jgi:Tol biopolymer transport system component/DNA-binding winged helix-turn-helix (wHTH) protein
VATGPVKIHETIRFGEDFELDCQSYKLHRAGRVLKLERIPFEILLLLVENRNQIVGRDEIVERVWGKNVFLDTDNSINGAIRKIRQVLRDDPDRPRFIQTISGRGYRFIGSLVEAGKLSGHPVQPADFNTPPPTPETEASRSSKPPTPELVSSEIGPAKWHGSRIWRRALVAVLLGIVAVAFLIGIRNQTGPESPFQVVRTVRLTSTGKESKAAISPDGRYIAHSVFEAGKESLRVRQAMMANDTEIVPPQPIRYLGVTFSPDSQMVYYVARKAGDEPGTLYRIPILGGDPLKVKDDLASPVTFSPDGKRFAFVRESATESMLVGADLQSGNEQTLIKRRLPEVLDYPAWSPQGGSIVCIDYNSAIASPNGSHVRLIEVGIGDRSERVLSRQTWGYVRKVAWLGDASGLVISARAEDETPFIHLWFVSYPGGNVRAITEGLNREISASVSADSRRIITIQENTYSSIWHVSSAGGQNAVLVVSSESGISGPAWTPDSRIVFEEELNGHRSVWSVDAAGNDRKQLTPEANNYDHSVSRNGQKLAFVSDRSGIPAIWTMDMNGGTTVMVAKPTGGTVAIESGPALSPDGKWLAFTSIGSGHWTTLWRAPSNGGEPVELNDKLWLRPVISPDGRWVAGFYADRGLNAETTPTGIAVIASDGGPVRKIIPIPFSVMVSGGLRWNPSGRELSYIDRKKDGANIWAQPLDGAAPRQVTRFQGVDLFSFDWSSDGKQLAVSRGVEARDVVLMEDAHRR